MGTTENTEKLHDRLMLLISGMYMNPETAARDMGITGDVLFVNQCDRYDQHSLEEGGRRILWYDCAERGVGLSRNTALLRADAEIVLFGDEDIVYDSGYRERVLNVFDAHPDADMVLFNVRQSEGRETYRNGSWKRIHWYNYGRYPAYSIAVRNEVLQKSRVTFSLLFGGGAKYSNGEDSLFLHDCLQYGMKIYASPVELGEEHSRPSTWFHGYTEKFFLDRGVLYRALYGRLDFVMALRFLLKNRGEMCQERPWTECYRLMKKGMRLW